MHCCWHPPAGPAIPARRRQLNEAMGRTNGPSGLTPAPMKRLPVNPRKNKVPLEARRRVATACNNCNVRRIKCSGSNPCQQCLTAKRECVYPPPNHKVTIAKAEWDNMQEKLSRWQWYARMSDTFDHLRWGKSPEPPASGSGDGVASAEVGPSTDSAFGPTGDALDPAVGAGDSEITIDLAEGYNTYQEPHEPQGKMLRDGLGKLRYHGETSGATFLDDLKHFISVCLKHEIEVKEPNGRYQTDDSHPLLLPHEDTVNPYDLPPMDEMQSMLRDLREFIMDGNGAWASGGIFFWPLTDLGDLVAHLHSPTPASSDRSLRGLALYNACFALITLLRSRQDGSRVNRPDGLPELYIARARKILGNPFDVHLYSIDDVPAIAMMSLFYVENNRRDFACSFISMAINLLRMHGVDRGSPVTPEQHRTFWTLYTLDRWLNCLMGRIPSIPDFAIHITLPEPCRGLPSPLGLRAHVELSYISDFIVHNSLPDKDADASGLLELPEGILKAHAMLDRWKEYLPDVLQFKPVGVDNILSDPFTGMYVEKAAFKGDRAHCMLQMAYNQLYILTVRPAFLGAIRSWVGNKLLQKPGVTTSSPEDSLSDSWKNTLRTCTDRAKENISLAIQLRGGMYGTNALLLQELHHLFNAAVVLMMYQSVFRHLRSQEALGISFAIDVFTREAGIGSAYAKDCFVVLHDLKKLVWQLRDKMYNIKSQQQQMQDNTAQNYPRPGEQILSSLIPITSGYEASSPPFATSAETAYAPQQNQDQHGPHMHPGTQRVPLRPYPDPETNRPSRPIKPEEWKEALETWVVKGVTGSYTDGGCMVDERN